MKKIKKIGGARKAKGGVSYPTLSPKQIKSFVTSLKAGQMVEITWIDAFSEKGWKEIPESNTAHPCAVVGYFINCADGYIRVGVNKSLRMFDGYPVYSDHWCVPFGMVVSLSLPQ